MDETIQANQVSILHVNTENDQNMEKKSSDQEFKSPTKNSKKKRQSIPTPTIGEKPMVKKSIFGLPEKFTLNSYRSETEGLSIDPRELTTNRDIVPMKGEVAQGFSNGMEKKLTKTSKTQRDRSKSKPKAKKNSARSRKQSARGEGAWENIADEKPRVQKKSTRDRKKKESDQNWDMTTFQGIQVTKNQAKEKKKAKDKKKSKKKHKKSRRKESGD